MFLHLWLKHNIQAGSGFWKAFLFAACSATYGQSLSKGVWSHLREKPQVAGFQENAFFSPTFFPVVRKPSMNLLLYMLFQQTLRKSSHMYTTLLHSSLSGGLTRIHFPRSIRFSHYILKSQYIDFLILCFKTCIHWQVHWVFSITHCSALHVCRQWHSSGIYGAFWLKLGKYIFCSHLCCQHLLWLWSRLSCKLWLSFAICNI